MTPAPATELPPGVQPVPGWARYGWLRAGFSTRTGGRSTVYGAGDQNLGWTTEDDPTLIEQSRRRYLAYVAGSENASLVTVNQIHSADVLDAEQEKEPLTTPEGRALLRGDGLVARTPGRFVGVATADCVPVLLADQERRVVAALHAGWRGTLAGIVARGVAMMRDHFGTQPEDLLAAIGPAIRACCFAVGPEVQAAFLAKDPGTSDLFQERRMASGSEAQLFLDLQAANRRQLIAAGLHPSSIEILPECTSCTRLQGGRRKYFSYRAEQGITGRMLNVIGVVPDTA